MEKQIPDLKDLEEHVMHRWISQDQFKNDNFLHVFRMCSWIQMDSIEKILTM